MTKSELKDIIRECIAEANNAKGEVSTNNIVVDEDTVFEFSKDLLSFDELIRVSLDESMMLESYCNIDVVNEGAGEKVKEFFKKIAGVFKKIADVIKGAVSKFAEFIKSHTIDKLANAAKSKCKGDKDVMIKFTKTFFEKKGEGDTQSTNEASNSFEEIINDAINRRGNYYSLVNMNDFITIDSGINDFIEKKVDAYFKGQDASTDVTKEYNSIVAKMIKVKLTTYSGLYTEAIVKHVRDNLQNEVNAKPGSSMKLSTLLDEISTNHQLNTKLSSRLSRLSDDLEDLANNCSNELLKLSDNSTATDNPNISALSTLSSLANHTSMMFLRLMALTRDCVGTQCMLMSIINAKLDRA